ncbi:MAG: bifunctional (p)ppGpp synthetase/guanosine-3',5'-bis(diphosphate) 3'-pyrophosphohydrolase [Gammaproteobacteria bacterium]|nr:bifunctional (p)ppGpp synthetase/guanosine-3',5'-bis(diphosphate) 3'-pyrophosphohydrolase [Gammaproteobacteria bacterium]
MAVLIRAANFAASFHRDQRRKDHAGSPYINHPLALADLLLNEAGVADLDILVAALLHDTLEDTDATSAEIEAVFGASVRSIVEEVSDDMTLARAVRKRLQIERAPQLSPAARAVKLADKTCNLRDVLVCPPAGWSLQRCREYFDWANAVIDGLRGEHARLEALFDEVYRLRP